MIISIIKKMKPNCSKIATVSIRIGITENRSLEPSRGGMGIRLKTAKRIFQKIIMARKVKKIELQEPEMASDKDSQLLSKRMLLMISALAIIGNEIILAKIAATKAKQRLEAGPASATSAGPHF